MSRRVLALFCFLLVALSPVFAGGPEIPYSDGVPLTPNVRPMIIVSGSDYDMGYQWYRQIVQVYGKKPCEELSHQKFSKEDLDALKAYQMYIEEHTPEMVDVLRGMVAGAAAEGITLTYQQILAKWADTSRFPLPPGCANVSFPQEEDCSGWAAWGSMTKDGKLYCGGSGDHQIIMGENEIRRFEYCVAMFPEKGGGNNVVFSTSTGCCWHASMNDKGAAMFHHGTTGYYGRYFPPDEQNYGYGVPNNMITIHTLRYANSAKEAQKLVLSLPSGDGRVGGAWADVNGNAFVIENRDNPRAIRVPGDYGEKDFIYSTNNLFSDKLKDTYKPPPGQKVVFIPHAGWLGTHGSLGSIGRNLELWNLFHNYPGQVDLDFSKMIWRFEGPRPPYATIDEAVADYEPSQAKLWNAHVSQPGNAMVGIMVPDNGGEGLYYVSQGCAVRGNESPTYPGGVVTRVAPTYSFYQFKLAETAGAALGAARTRAQYDLYNAYQELSKLTYWDVPFAPLNDLIDEGTTEFQKGEYYSRISGMNEGNEAANLQAKATRSYFRAQALALQVQNALVPPAERPEELGLPEWLGVWGDWATRGEN
ncbi:hypothetical protein ACFLT7_02450 [candidate division KSB1 bacterium]